MQLKSLRYTSAFQLVMRTGTAAKATGIVDKDKWQVIENVHEPIRTYPYRICSILFFVCSDECLRVSRKSDSGKKPLKMV